MRPRSIVNFERVIAVMILIWSVNLVLTWDRLIASIAGTGYGQGFLIGAHLGLLAFLLVLVAFITRGRSNVARWIYVLLTAAGIVFLLADDLPPAHELPLLLIEIAQWLLSFLGVWLLFRPDAQAWFEARVSPAEK